MIKVKSLATDEIGLNEALALRGIAGDRDRSRRADRPARRRRAVAHPRPRDPPQPRRDRRAVRAHDRRRARSSGSSRPRSPRRPAGTCARSSSRCRSRSAARTSRSPRPASVGVVESEGNGRMCTTLPNVLITLMGIEKVLPEWRDLEVMLQLLPRSSTAERMNPYTSIWTGVREDDGPREFHLVLLDAGRTRRARRRGRPPGAALHPLLGLPELLPGLLAHGRARLRVGLSGPDRRDPDAAARRARPARRRCRGRRRCAARATRSARSRSTSRPCSCTCAGGSCDEVKSRWSPERLAMDALARVFRSRGRYERAQRMARAGNGPLARHLPGPLRGWTAMRELPDVPQAVVPRLVGRAAAGASGRRRAPTPRADRTAGRRHDGRARGGPRPDPRRARRRRGRAGVPRDYHVAGSGAGGRRARRSSRASASARREYRPRSGASRRRSSRTPSRRRAASRARAGSPSRPARRTTSRASSCWSTTRRSRRAASTRSTACSRAARSRSPRPARRARRRRPERPPRADARPGLPRLPRRGRRASTPRSPTRSPRSRPPPPRAGRSRSSPARARRRTSSSSGSRASTGRARS